MLHNNYLDYGIKVLMKEFKDLIEIVKKKKQSQGELFEKRYNQCEKRLKDSKESKRLICNDIQLSIRLLKFIIDKN